MIHRTVVLLTLIVASTSAFVVPSSVSHSRASTMHQMTPADIPDLPMAVQELANTAWLLADDAGATKDLGWWGSFINIFKIGLEGVHSTVDGPLQSMGIENTWGISIAIFTFLCRAVLVPISIQQSQSAEYMKLLKPYQQQIKERFPDNQDAQNRAIGKLYEDANQNPLAGCFISLAQLPIFLGLYRGVRMLAVENKLDEPFLWIPSLEGPVSAASDYRGLDWLTQGWTTTVDGTWTPALGWETTLAFLIMPVILVVLQGTTMSVLSPAADVDENSSDEERQTVESTQRVLKFLPLLIGFFSIQVPAGLTIYWFMSNIFTLSQSLAVRAYFAANPPKIELPEYWNKLDTKKKFKDMTPDERREAMQSGVGVGPTLEEMVDEAMFHVFVERRPLRTTDVSGSIPTELAAWVAAGPDTASTTKATSNDTAAATV